MNSGNSLPPIWSRTCVPSRWLRDLFRFFMATSLLQSSTHPWPLPFFLARLSVRWEISAKSPPQLCMMLGPDWKQRPTVNSATKSNDNYDYEKQIYQNCRTDYPAIIIPYYQSIAGVNVETSFGKLQHLEWGWVGRDIWKPLSTCDEIGNDSLPPSIIIFIRRSTETPGPAVWIVAPVVISTSERCSGASPKFHNTY